MQVGQQYQQEFDERKPPEVQSPDMVRHSHSQFNHEPAESRTIKVLLPALDGFSSLQNTTAVCKTSTGPLCSIYKVRKGNNHSDCPLNFACRAGMVMARLSIQIMHQCGRPLQNDARNHFLDQKERFHIHGTSVQCPEYGNVEWVFKSRIWASLRMILSK